MHKGFAFVQFTNPFDARSACVGEDARTVLGQTLGNYYFNYSQNLLYKYTIKHDGNNIIQLFEVYTLLFVVFCCIRVYLHVSILTILSFKITCQIMTINYSYF